MRRSDTHFSLRKIQFGLMSLIWPVSCVEAFGSAQTDSFHAPIISEVQTESIEPKSFFKRLALDPSEATEAFQEVASCFAETIWLQRHASSDSFERRFDAHLVFVDFNLPPPRT
jgi:hypothetical protein